MSQEAPLKHMLMWPIPRRPVIGPDCSKCPAPLTRSDDVVTHVLIGCCLFRPEGGASVSPVHEEAEPERSSANQSQGKRSRKHRKRNSDGERSHRGLLCSAEHERLTVFSLAASETTPPALFDVPKVW